MAMTLGSSPAKVSCIVLNNNNLSPKDEFRMIELQRQRDNMSSASSTASSTSSSTASDMVRCKRKINFQNLQYSMPHSQPVAVARRNARERNRVKQVNNGFSTLRQHIPFTARNKKMSKVETLRCAVEYIRSLQQLLDSQGGGTTIKTEQDEVLSPASGSLPPSPMIDQQQQNIDIVQQTDFGYYSGGENIILINEAAATNGPYHQQTTLYPQHATSPTILHHLQPASLSPPCSNSEPASSPAPSFDSETSSTYHVPQQLATQTQQQTTTINYDNYEPMSPEDEELLDVISWWQQSQ